MNEDRKKIHSLLFAGIRIIVPMLILLYVIIEIKLSSIPFINNVPCIFSVLFQKPSEESVSYLVFNIVRSLVIGVFGALLYDMFAVRIPKYDNISKHKATIERILMNVEEIIAIYLLSNGYENSNFSNLKSENFENTGICLTNEVKYYKDEEYNYCNKFYIFKSYKKNVDNIKICIDRILNSRFPLPHKYEIVLNKLVTSDFISYINRRNLPAIANPNIPFEHTISFNFKYFFINNLYDYYEELKHLVTYCDNYLLKRIEKKEYLNGYLDGIVFCGAERFLYKETLTSDIDDIKEIITMYKNDDSKNNNFIKVLSVVCGISKEVEKAYFESLNIDYDNSEEILYKWVNLLKYCISLLSDTDLCSNTARIDIYIEYYRYKYNLNTFDNNDKEYLNEFINANIELFTATKLFYCYVLSKNIQNARNLFNSLDNGQKQEVMNSPLWDIYSNLSI